MKWCKNKTNTNNNITSNITEPKQTTDIKTAQQLNNLNIFTIYGKYLQFHKFLKQLLV